MQDNITLIISGIPGSKQSARFRISKNKQGKHFVTSYQKKEVKDQEKNTASAVLEQLPKGFIPFDETIFADVQYVFPMPASFSKKQKELVESGKKVWKNTKPDITDNLNKGLFDALEGILFINDSRIAGIKAVKYYGLVPQTILKIWTEKEVPA